jgi:spermidine synthase
MNNAYPLFPITVLAVLFYALSFGFSKVGLVSRANHRKFWNVLLLITFLVSGLLGLLMVLKVNYKVQIPAYEQLVALHVDFGIGMVIVAFFHFWWNSKYYLKLFKGGKQTAKESEFQTQNDLDESRLKLAAFLLGSTTIMTQIILLREFLAVFSGNELVIGLVMANWMILTGLGAFLGKFQLRFKSSVAVITGGLLLLSVLPFVTTFLINFLKNRIFPIGALIGVFPVFYASFLLLVPFCLLSGFLFTFIVKSFSELRNQNETGIIYGFESVGSIAGGLVSGLLFVSVLSSVESLLMLAILNGAVLFLISLQKTRKRQMWIPLAVAVPAFMLLFFHPEKFIRSFVYPNQEIEVSKDSPHGNIVITRREKMVSVYTNNNLMFDSENFMVNEEAVHFPMLQHPDPKSVLIVSGDLAGEIAEAKKYKPASIECVDDNRWLLSLLSDTLKKLTNDTVKITAADPVRFIRRTTKRFDVVVLNLPGPSTLQSNRFYTLEFFTLLKSKLNPEGVFSFSILSPPNYLNQEAVDLNSTLFVTLKKVFQNVIIIPGEKNYFLASDGPLGYNIAQAVQEKGIENQYVNPYYIDDGLLKSRGENILAALNLKAAVNQNLKPVSYYQQLAYWLSQFKGSYRWMAVAALVLALAIFFRGKAPSKVMFVTGFTATGMEILLLFGLQVSFGNIYLLTSFVFAGFMLGLAVGSFFGKSVFSLEKNLLYKTQFLIGLFVALAGASLFSSGMEKLPDFLIYFLFLLATVLTGGLTGFQFSVSSLSATGTYAGISGETYSYDLAGSAFGALAVSIYLVPFWGIVPSVFILAVLNLLFGIWLILKRKFIL